MPQPRLFRLRLAFSLLALPALAGCVGTAGPVPMQPVAQPAPVPNATYQRPEPGVYYTTTCFAGFYTCPLPQSLPAGTACTCPGLGAPSYGMAR